MSVLGHSLQAICRWSGREVRIGPIAIDCCDAIKSRDVPTTEVPFYSITGERAASAGS
jgi:hypothetical protein